MTISAYPATFQENGARVFRADVIYAINPGDKTEEWLRAFGEIDNGVLNASFKIQPSSGSGDGA